MCIKQMVNGNVIFKNEAKEKLIEGVNLITDAISVTYGPKGLQCAIKSHCGVKLTKDGATVAQSVNSQDPYVSMGIELIREISKKTADEVGDGSSTVAILARAIIEKFKGVQDSIELYRELQNYTDKVISTLKEWSIPIESKEDICKVASLSANNDTKIGNIIAEAYYKVGKNGLVTFEQSDEAIDRIEYSKGFRVDSGYSSPYFINTSKGTCELENVLVYISDTKMDEVKEVIALAEEAMKQKKSLALIAPEFNSEIYIFLKSNLELLKSCTIISPNFRNYRQIMMDDIKDILGETSSCQKIICDSKTTTFIGYQSNTENINKKIDLIQNIIKDNVMNQFDIDFNKKRLANFTSGIATIYVGGYSRAELLSKMDLYEDAVNATKQALLDGVLPGGGAALLKVSKDYDNDFGEILQTPAKLLRTLDISYNEMLKRGILEPYNVTKATLVNAVSIAGQILSCNCAIVNEQLFE